MDDLISRKVAIEALEKAIKENPYYDSNEPINGLGICDVRVVINDLPSAQPEQRWNKLMMYLADLQLTYSPGWGANGQGDEKLYEFVSGLIEELREWEEGEQG